MEIIIKPWLNTIAIYMVLSMTFTFNLICLENIKNNQFNVVIENILFGIPQIRNSQLWDNQARTGSILHISLILKAKYLKEKVKTKERNKPRSNRGDKASLILSSKLKQLLNSYRAKNSLIFFSTISECFKAWISEEHCCYWSIKLTNWIIKRSHQVK